VCHARHLSRLRDGTNNHVSVVELSFNAIERSFQLYLVEMTAADSSDYRSHGAVFDDIEARNVFSDESVAGRIDAFRSEHRSRFYYDVDRPGRDFATAMHDLAEAVHRYVVEFADAQSQCRCDR
jgi:hypothetical protein